MAKLVSVIVEWENAKLAELERAERMLAALGTQMADAARRRGIRAELIVLYDSDGIDIAVPRTAVESHIDASAWPGTIRLVAAPGQRYYQQKNKGAELASGDILLFLDSDVVPDPGWLEAMLAALDDPEVAFVGGHAYHATDTLYDRLFAAFWEFPQRPSQRGLYRHKSFYANNLAVRRALFLANPYPDADSYRVQCSQLAQSLRAKGIAIYRHADASVSHPPPEGGRMFVVRAICRGHDAIYWRRRRRLGVLLHANPVASCVRWLRQLWQVLGRVATRSRALGLGPVGAATAVVMGVAFYSCQLAGEVVCFFAPRLIRNNFSV